VTTLNQVLGQNIEAMYMRGSVLVKVGFSFILDVVLILGQMVVVSLLECIQPQPLYRLNHPH
jgi:hypothetical protein